VLTCLCGCQPPIFQTSGAMALPFGAIFNPRKKIVPLLSLRCSPNGSGCLRHRHPNPVIHRLRHQCPRTSQLALWPAEPYAIPKTPTIRVPDNTEEVNAQADNVSSDLSPDWEAGVANICSHSDYNAATATAKSPSAGKVKP
jgi:hypothetical protein